MNTLSPDFWARVEAVVEAALQVPPAERAHVLDEVCAADPHLRAEVDSLLASHDRAGTFLEGRALDGSDLIQPADLTGRIVGGFRLLEKIGEGGMGVVYRAERVDGGFTQRVAVKLLDAPLRDAEMMRRFRAERQILASLNHPHIVTLVDSGITADGQPYLVMEHVIGIPVTAYCAGRALGLEDRLRLFQQVCGAVQDAHQHGVVHRDLKPGNILVTADGIPKILDFGVAKLLDASGAAADVTVSGLLRHLTPNYASPEQVRGLPVTTACDIYALGVLLYELLTGARCYDTTGKALDEVLRVIVDEEPRRPSAASVAPESRVPYGTRRLRGDLDTIVLKAMAKGPSRRYASARELSDDIARHLAGRPVLARELSLGYTASRLARRHRAAAAAAAFSLAVLLGALGVSLWQMRIAVTERNRARLEAAKAQQVAGFLRNLFSSAYPRNRVPGAKLTAQDLVDKGVERVEELSGQPDVQASMLAILGAVYTEMGLYRQALPLVERSLAIREQLLGPDHLEVAESLYALGRVRGYLGEFAAAQPYQERAVKIREAASGPDDPLLAEALSDLGSTYWRRGRPEGRAYLERAVAIEERRGGPQLSRWLTNLANYDFLADDYAAAQRLLERGVAAGARVESEPGYLVNVTILNLGLLLRSQEDFARSRQLLEQALGISNRLYGPEHQATIHNWGELGELYFVMGDRARAREFLDRSIAAAERHLGRDHLAVAPPLLYKGRILFAEGRVRDASALFERALRIREKVYGESHASTADVLVDVARATMKLEGPAAGEPKLRRALAIHRQTLAPNHRRLLPSLLALIEALPPGAHGEARALAQEAVQIARAKLPPHHSQRLRAEAALQKIGTAGT